MTGLVNGLGRRLVTIPHVWSMCYVPSGRTLAAILTDVTDHATAYPTHGIDCVCMDTYIREIRIHARRAIPGTEDYDSVDSVRFEMHARVRYVLGAVARSI